MTVPLKPGEGGLRRRSMVNPSRLFIVDMSRLRRRLGVLPQPRMEMVNAAIKVSLDVA